MNFTLHQNKWTVIVKDWQFNNCTQDDINFIAKLLAKYTLVVFKNQELTVSDEIRIADMFGNVERFIDEKLMVFPYQVNGSDGYALRVSGAKDEDGFTGIAGYEREMPWHANDATKANRRSLIWLFSAHGSKGSRTTWNNNMKSFSELDEDTKNKLKKLKIIPAKNVPIAFESNKTIEPVQDFRPNLIAQNIAGFEGLYYPFLQTYGFDGLDDAAYLEIKDWLVPYTIQEKFCYHHDWEDGDVVIADQWMGIHKRWPFKDIAKRELHRIAFDYPIQDYNNLPF